MLEFIHFDTINATNTVTNDPYDMIFKLNNTISKIDKIYLKSLEMPILFDNVRANNLNTFKISCSSGTYTATLTPKSYTSITTLLTDLNTRFSGVISNTTITFSVVADKVRLTANSATVNNFAVVATNLSKYILGFKNASTSISGNDTYIDANLDPILNIDNYVVLSVENFNSVRNTGNFEFTFKIPLNAATGTIYYVAENESFTQFVKVHNESFNLHSLRVKVLDRFGNLISGPNADYSFTLGLQYISC